MKNSRYKRQSAGCLLTKPRSGLADVQVPEGGNQTDTESETEQDELQLYLSGIKHLVRSTQQVHTSREESKPSNIIDWSKLMETEENDAVKHKEVVTQTKHTLPNFSRDNVSMLSGNDDGESLSQKSDSRCSSPNFRNIHFIDEFHADSVSMSTDSKGADSNSSFDIKGNVHFVDELHTSLPSCLPHVLSDVSTSKRLEEIDAATPQCTPSASPVNSGEPKLSFKFSVKDDPKTPCSTAIHNESEASTCSTQSLEVEASVLDYTLDFSQEEQLDKSDIVSVSSHHQPLEPTTNDIYTQTSQLDVERSVAASTHQRKEYLDPSPVVLSTTLEAMTLSPGVMALNDMLRLQLQLTQQQVDHSRQLCESLISSLKPNYHYTTLQSTKRFIAKNKPRITTLAEAKKKVDKYYH